jgi:hypothetical protein
MANKDGTPFTRPGVATRHGSRQKPRFLPAASTRGLEKIVRRRFFPID